MTWYYTLPPPKPTIIIHTHSRSLPLLSTLKKRPQLIVLSSSRHYCCWMNVSLSQHLHLSPSDWSVTIITNNIDDCKKGESCLFLYFTFSLRATYSRRRIIVPCCWKVVAQKWRIGKTKLICREGTFIFRDLDRPAKVWDYVEIIL